MSLTAAQKEYCRLTLKLLASEDYATKHDQIANDLDVVWYHQLSVKDREQINDLMREPSASELIEKLKALLEEK